MDLPFYLSQALTSQGWMYWSANLWIIALTALFCLVILHMIAIALQLEKFKSWIKGEYLQVIVTFFLVVILLKTIQIGWLIMLEMVRQIYFSNPYLAQLAAKEYSDVQNIYFDPFEFGQNLLKNAYMQCQVDLYKFLYYINWFWKIKASEKYETQGPEALAGWYATAYTAHLEYLMARLSHGILFNWIQITFLAIIKYVAPLLIQIGLILRIIPYSRGTGALLIAIGIGFFAVYPISLALMLSLQPPGASCTEFVPPPIMQKMVEENNLADINALIQQTNFVILGHQNEIEYKVSKVKTYAAMLFLQAVVLPVASLTIVFTFTRQLSNILGADLNEIGRGLIKLI